MAKLLVNLEIPAISENFDILIPDFMKVRVLLPLLAATAVELSNERYVPSGQECLCSRELDKVLDKNSTVIDCGIRHGDHLLLF